MICSFSSNAFQELKRLFPNSLAPHCLQEHEQQLYIRNKVRRTPTPTSWELDGVEISMISFEIAAVSASY
jgi:hypothetical protein